MQKPSKGLPAITAAAWAAWAVLTGRGGHRQGHTTFRTFEAGTAAIPARFGPDQVPPQPGSTSTLEIATPLAESPPTQGPLRFVGIALAHAFVVVDTPPLPRRRPGHR